MLSGHYVHMNYNAAGAWPFRMRRQRASALLDSTSSDSTAHADDERAAVETAIGNVDREITKVSEKIGKVEDAIESGKMYLGMQGKDLISYLSKLLKKEEQLRKKEEQLRDEKSECNLFCIHVNDTAKLLRPEALFFEPAHSFCL
jgi:DNA repair exonuclease SbcCD ATPase subunit